MARRKYIFRDRAEAEDAYRKSEADAMLAQIALADVLRGKVDATFRRGSFTVRLIRVMGASAGIVIVEQRKTTYMRVSELDSYHDWILNAVRLLGTDDKERMDHFQAVHDAVNFRRSAFEAARAG